MLLSNLSELWSAVGRWSAVALAVCFGQFPYNLPLHVARRQRQRRRRLLLVVFIVFSVFFLLFCSFLGRFAHGETVETHYTNADLRSQTTYGFN